MAFIFLGVMSLPAMLLTWLGGRTVTSLLPVLDAGGGAIFMIGIQVFIMSWIIGFLALLLARLAAEYTLAIFTMVNDIGMLRRHVIPADPGAGDQMPVVPGPQSDHPSMVDTETEDQ